MMFSNADQTLLNLAESEFYRANQNKDFRDNTKFADSQTLQMQRQSDLTRPTNQITGFSSAGFSPLASLGNVAQSPVTSSNVAMPVPRGNVAPSSSTLLELEQAKNLNAQTENLKIKNRREQSEDNGSAQALFEYANAKLKDNPNMTTEQKAYWESILERDPATFNVGDINAELNFKKLVTADVDSTANAIKKSYESYMWNAYKQGKMPYLEISKNENEVRKLIAELANIEANTLLTSASTLMKPNEMRKIDSETAKNIAEANSIYHGDIVSLFQNGDYQALLVLAGQMVLKGLIDYGVYKGAGKAVHNVLSNGNSPTLNKTKQLKSDLSKAQKKNERIRKYVEQRERERRSRASKSAFPL